MSPEVLLDRAKTIAATLAPDETIADSAWGFDADLDYLREMGERDPSAGRLKRLEVERPGPLLFWYRASRAPLVARTWQPLPLDSWRPPRGRVTRETPIVPGMLKSPTRWHSSRQRVRRGDSLIERQAIPSPSGGHPSRKLTRQTSAGRGDEDAIAWRGPFPDAPGSAQIDASIRDGRVSRSVGRDDPKAPTTCAR
jgi:hypothetical protein